MIFVANVLVMNGGSTFLIRMCRELGRRGVPCAVVLLREAYDQPILDELKEYADVLHLKDYLYDRAILFRKHLGVFGAVNWKRLRAALAAYGNVIHAMGAFGLIFSRRLAHHIDNCQVTAGIYHQNEFLFRRSPFHFPNRVQSLFRELPAENLVFFNESSQEHYRTFFEREDYLLSTVIPIGIDLPPRPSRLRGPNNFLVVSVGNLFGFKTYNKHMVGTVSRLAQRFPQLRYDIYGVGPEEEELKALISKLGLGDRVQLKGTLPYSKFRSVVAGADLFVGSGTAVIEAAALGVPALVGVESQQTPETYGFLSDVRGLSYNENIAGMPKYPMLDLVEKLFSDSDYRTQTASASAAKAQEFSVARTADGFMLLRNAARPVRSALPRRALLRMLFSLIGMALAERGSHRFRDRRDQSY